MGKKQYRYYQQCQFCNKSSTNLGPHLRRHIQENPFFCPICPKEFPYSRDLKSHLNTPNVHKSDANHICKVCGDGYDTLAGLKAHVKSHSQERPNQCKQCGKGFVTGQDLYRHVRDVHEKLFKCNLCKRRFGSPADLEKHVSAHTMEKPFKCEICLKQFSRQDNMRRHVAIYHTVKLETLQDVKFVL